MKFVYLSAQDVFFGSDGKFYTHEELDYIDKLEKEWKAALPNLTLVELMEIFPNARPVAKRAVRENIKKVNETITAAVKERENFDTIIQKAPFTEQSKLIEEANTTLVKTLEILEKRKRELSYQMDFLMNKPSSPHVVTIQDIEAAKAVPIKNIYKGTLKGSSTLLTGLCPFHNEKTPSFTVYTKQNRWHCFGENKGGDVIDLVQHYEQCDFKSAVKKLK